MLLIKRNVLTWEIRVCPSVHMVPTSQVLSIQTNDFERRHSKPTVCEQLLVFSVLLSTNTNSIKSRWAVVMVRSDENTEERLLYDHWTKLLPAIMFKSGIMFLHWIILSVVAVVLIRASNEPSRRYYNHGEGPWVPTSAFTFKNLLKHYAEEASIFAKVRLKL